MINKILFISPDASKTGAPKVLLLLMQWLKKNHPGVELTLYVIRKGELYNEFEKTVDFIYTPTRKPLQDFISRILKRKRTKTLNTVSINKKISRQSYDIVYCNSVNTFKLGCAIKNKNPDSKLIGHLHEMRTVIDILNPSFKDQANIFNKFIAASFSVKGDLINCYGILDSKISVVYEFSSIKSVQKEEMEKKYFHIGGAGTVHWRKGVDVFIQVARILKEKNPEISTKFTWLGAISREQRIIQEADLKKLGLINNVSFIGLIDDPERIYSTLDVFLLTSREDPFPLVAIEVGTLGVPIICFKTGTGTEEILKKGGGVIVPYLNPEAMADSIVNYFKNPDLHFRHSEEGKTFFSKFNPEEKSNEIFQILKEVTRSNSLY